MKAIAIFILITLFLSCKKNETVNEAIPEGTVLKMGTFVTNAKATSGTVKVVAATNGTKKLVFEGFSTGSGPDVRVWLAPSTNPTTYQEVGALRANATTFSYDLATTINYDTNNKVLIWCEDFSVLFGSATLQ
jgi:hypothetical protein